MRWRRWIKGEVDGRDGKVTCIIMIHAYLSVRTFIMSVMSMLPYHAAHPLLTAASFIFYYL